MDKRTGLLKRLSYSLPRAALKIIADGICMSKIRYGLAVYGVPRTSPTESVDQNMKRLQVKVNDILRTILGKKRLDKIRVKDLHQTCNIPTINQMALGVVMLEMWKTMTILKNTDLHCGKRGQ